MEKLDEKWEQKQSIPTCEVDETALTVCYDGIESCDDRIANNCWYWDLVNVNGDAIEESLSVGV